MKVVRPHPRPPRRDAAYYRSAAWKRRVRQVRLRAGGWCEFCRRRAMQACHHRTYRHFGQEPLTDLMAVCRPCHRAIHHRGRRGLGAAGSLLAQKDSGMGLPPVWLAYVRRVTRLPGEFSLSCAGKWGILCP
jgi:hypothetical protein